MPKSIESITSAQVDTPKPKPVIDASTTIAYLKELAGEYPAVLLATGVVAGIILGIIVKRK